MRTAASGSARLASTAAIGAVTTKTDSLSLAQEFAKNWYLGLLGQSRAGLLEETKKGKKFKEAAAQLLTELPMLTHGERSERYVDDQKKRLDSVILPFLGDRYLSEAPGSISEYRIHRAETCKTGKPPSRSTTHQEIVVIRQVYKCASGTDGSITFRTFPYPTKHREKSSVAHGFRRRSTKRSTKPPANGRGNPASLAGKRTAKSSMTTSCSWPTPACGRTKPRRLQYRDVNIVEDETTGATHPGNRGSRQTRYWLLQEHARRRDTLRAPHEAQ